MVSTNNPCHKTSLFISVIGSLSLVLAGCSLPTMTNRTISHALPINPNTTLARRILPEVQKNAGQTGAYLLYDGQDAFAARLTLSEKAQTAIDAQYYIWKDDISGRLLLNSMYKAAERGVRVRLLLDDNATKGMDELLTRFNQHPNIEVRLFNPYVQRQFRSIAYVTDTVRINRRMHNKSFTVDGVVSIIGGRNVADEYYEATNGLLFTDLDVSVVGDVVQDIQQDFDKYWHSQSSYPIDSIVKVKTATPPPSATPPLAPLPLSPLASAQQANPIKITEPARTKDYLFSLFTTQYPQYIADDDFQLLWGKATFFSDPPSKVTQGRSFRYEDSAFAKVAPLANTSQSQLFIISPYFVPTQQGTDFLIALVNRGVRVIILTNSLAATDVTLVHSGYIKYRQTLINGGVEVYEYKDMPKVDDKETANSGNDNSNGNSRGKNKRFAKKRSNVKNIFPASNASLHAKAFTIDGKYLFIGSPNLDPRSAMLNTELGIVFENEQLAQIIDNTFYDNKAEYSYQVTNRLNNDNISDNNNASDKHNNKLQWTTVEDGRTVIFYDEPNAHFGEKTMAKVLSVLPIDGWL